ncbi:MAG: DUF4349 domain-containing protein [Acidimicrobiales bacterium]
MTMIDEDTLRSALHDTADAFDVTSETAQSLFAQIRDDHENESRVTHLLREPSRTRRVMMGAAALVVALAVGVPLAIHQSARPIHPVVGALVPPGEKLSTTGAASAAAGHSSSAQGVVTTGSGLVAKSATNQRIESTGTIAIRVANSHIESALNKLSTLATSDHGYVESTQAATGSQVPRSFTNASVVLEVPQATFHHLVSQVQGVGRTTSLATNSSNVTSEYVNYQARIDALKVSLHQYLAIMTHATTISGILAVQSQINQIQSQIEQEQGQLNVLNHQTTYASLTVNVTTPSHHAATTRRSGLDKAFHDSVSGFVTGFEWLIRLAGPVLFSLIALGALSLLGRYAWRGIRRRRI